MLKLTRKRPPGWIRIFPIAVNIVVFILAVYANTLMVEGTINSSVALKACVYAAVVLSTILFADNISIFNPKNVVQLEVDGDIDKLFRQYQRIVLDAKMSVTELDFNLKKICTAKWELNNYRVNE